MRTVSDVKGACLAMFVDLIEPDRHRIPSAAVYQSQYHLQRTIHSGVPTDAVRYLRTLSDTGNPTIIDSPTIAGHQIEFAIHAVHKVPDRFGRFCRRSSTIEFDSFWCPRFLHPIAVCEVNRGNWIERIESQELNHRNWRNHKNSNRFPHNR